jgi:ubiquinone/menaquinone biosynthesis C-methylase UbiE
MNLPSLDCFCDPHTQDPLELRGDALVNLRSGRRYPIREGMPVFIDAVTGPNRKFQQMYDRIAPIYDAGDLLGRIYLWLRRIKNFRSSIIAELQLPPAGRLLEVSVGTGLNLRHIPAETQAFGLELSWGMLRKCRKNLRRWNRTAQLCQGEGENLPFRDNSFDAVLHVGGINFFNDKGRAIREMVRVARPGAKIVISDETEAAVKGVYEKNPMIGKEYRGRDETVRCPIDELPAGMLEVRARELFGGKMYCLSFRKP